MMVFASTWVLVLVKDGLAALLACAVIVSTALSLYLLLLAVASLRRPVPASVRGTSATRFEILVPAHEEELVIGKLLDSVNELDYSRDLFGVHVITDHCSDQTASIARGLGAIVYERSDPDPRGKSQSLNWLVKHLLDGDAGDAIDAFVVIDADSVVSPNFLREMALHVQSGTQIVQGLVQVDGAGTNVNSQLRALAYEFISHVRPLGRSALGLSAGLRGNGMCITRDCAARYPWDPQSLTEDYELHGRLLAAGLHVSFAPAAIVRTQLPQTLAVAQKQSERWESGRLDVMRRHVPALLGDGLRRRSWSSIDGALELVIPPFSILAALTFIIFGLSLLSGIGPLIVMSAIAVVAQCLYTMRGLRLASTRNPHIYRALLFAPLFVLSRVWRYVVVLTRRGRVQWTPTVRTPPP
jgi:cellulose synthase/poly-beta-1,6-N-acetylglucosamine synthase-like glycosyltransferase